MCKCTCVYITHIYAKENNSNLKNSIISTKCPQKTMASATDIVSIEISMELVS